MACGPRFDSFMLRQDGDAQAAGETAELPPGPPHLPPGPPPPPFPPSGPPPLPAQRAVRFRGQIVGHVDPDGVFVRRVHGRHVLRYPPAIALHIDVLAELVRLGVVAVAFTLDDGTALIGPLSLYTGPRAIDVDRAGYGPQRAVLVADFGAVEVRRASPADVLAFGR
mgnify:CR=1 FL=1